MIPPKPGTSFDQALQNAYDIDPSTPVRRRHSFWSAGDAETLSKAEDLRRKRRWRIGSSELEFLRETAKKFEGTHNFHNFTVGRNFSDPSNQRHMKQIEVSDSAVYGETEWVSVMFHGQSFMLHQIRKMMAALILVCRSGTPQRVIDELYGPNEMFVPKMPSLGLLLEQPIFDSYNRRVEGINEKLQPTDAEYRPPINFDIYKEKIQTFKQKHIYDNMRNIEDRSGLFDAWIQSVDSYGGCDLLYLNPAGVIPPEAIRKKGTKRDNPFREKKRFDATSFPASGENAKVAQDYKDEEMDDEDEPLLDKKQLMDMEG
jgi:tRNA pseudouridine38-40 synthase